MPHACGRHSSPRLRHPCLLSTRWAQALEARLNDLAEELDRTGARVDEISDWKSLVSTRTAASAKTQVPQWLEPRNITELEWFVLKRQADEGDTTFGEDGVTVNFYLGPGALTTGTVHCDIDYLPGTPAELVDAIETGIRYRFELRPEPWVKVEIRRRVARLR